MEKLRICPTSVIKRQNRRRIDISAHTERAGHYILTVFEEESKLATCEFAIGSGDAKAVLWLDLPRRSFMARWVICDLLGNAVACQTSLCEAPREWTVYVMVSSHTDIGLHNSQYIQRYNSSQFIDKAAQLCDETAGRGEENQYRYTVEGTWVWNNYLEDRSAKESENILENYIKKGKIGICAGVAGNHTQVFGFEELCRSAYSRSWLEQKGIECNTATMIDNNGLSWAMVQPYADAGYKNIIFSPNQWNPMPSTVWHCDKAVEGYIWNTEAGGGGARIDVKYGSALPMLFWWEGADKKRMLVWASTQYDRGGEPFGIKRSGSDIGYMEEKMASQLKKLEEKCPYDIWFVVNYSDDQEPSLKFYNSLYEWNKIYEFPKLQMLGNPDGMFDIMRERYGDKIPTLRGDITGGWYQHPLSAAELLEKKLNTDRALANAEKIASIASLYGKDYRFPKNDFNRAWAALIMNDEHSYGTSGYQGRRVYETWIGHRDWLSKASKIASDEAETALNALGKNIKGSGNRTLLFNPVAFERKHNGIQLPAFGYRVVNDCELKNSRKEFLVSKAPPIIENDFYLIKFAENGAMSEIFDKQLKRIINSDNCNQLMYTKDNHKTFVMPAVADFSVSADTDAIAVKITSSFRELGAELITTISLPTEEKRIDIDNKILHARDMFNDNRYKRYLYFAFPFDVPKATRICELGGIEAEYGVDITTHGTDVYMAAHEYACANSEEENFGVGLIQLDSQLIEFDHIHPDKTDFGNLGTGSAIFSYVANDWLQMHLSGGSALNYRFRYSIVSYSGTHKSCGLSKIAELLANPIYEIKLKESHEGILPTAMSFFETDARLVGLKPAADGNGLIARLLGSTEAKQIKTVLGSYRSVSIDEEREYPIGNGFSTLRIATENIPERADTKTDELAIGGVETGLVTAPRAARGEDDGMLYLLWGKCASENLAYYELWRDGEPIAKVEPEEYVVGRYIDTGLEKNKSYSYRVRAVDKAGNIGEFSEEFGAFTKE